MTTVVERLQQHEIEGLFQFGGSAWTKRKPGVIHMYSHVSYGLEFDEERPPWPKG